MGKAKIFVLDTNVILHDHKAIRKFQDNNLVIPIAVVEELDKFKKGNDALAYNARGFMRDIDRITEGKDFGRDGLPIAQGLGRIKVEPNHPFSEEYAAMFANLSFIGNCQKGYNAALARGIGDNQEALRAWYGYTMDLLNGKIDIDTWGKMHQENQMGHLAEVLAASKINPSDLDNPANEPTGE